MDLINWFAVMLIVGVPVMLGWISVLYWLARRLGIPAQLRWRRKTGLQRGAAQESLTRLQHVVLNGVLGWGVGCALLITGVDYVGYKIGFHGPVSVSDFAEKFVVYPLGGVLFGFFTWKHRPEPLVH